MHEPCPSSYMADMATQVSTSILNIVGARLHQAIADTPSEIALRRCYQAALAAWLPQDDPVSTTYRPILEEWLAEPAVHAELAKLVRGRQPDYATLRDSVLEISQGHGLPPEALSARLAAGVEAFLHVAAQEPALAQIIHTTPQRDATESPRAVVSAPPGTGDIPVGRDVYATNLVTGVQINPIVQVYRTAGGVWDEADYRAALGRYLEWLGAAMSRVVLRGIKRGDQQAVELSLHDVYVPLAAEAVPEALESLKRSLRGTPSEVELMAPHTPAERITMGALLAQGNRLAVIGAPGCGKTTVLQHIACTLAVALHTDQPDLAATRLGLTGTLPLPIYVPLSLYADHCRRFADHPAPHQRQLATFINHYLMERQAGLNLPDDFFARLLNQGQHVLLLLDGLDEVPTEEERALVSQAVQDLTDGRSHARFVVTCRTQAYQGQAVLGHDFRMVRVLALAPEHVADLIRQAYHAIYPAEVERDERERQATNLIDSVTRLEAARAARLGSTDENRLVTTPLLVRMLLIVHFNLRRLPEQRAELYMQVVDTLLTSAYNPDAAVAQRLAHLGGDWRHRRDLLQYLAFQMHSRGQEAGREIGERALTEVLCAYLIDRRHTAPTDAESFVAELVSSSRQRGGLLEEQAGRYRFSHLSMQEFLTARYLAEVEREVGRIATFLEENDRLTDAWWREPILLMGGYLHVTASDVAADLVHRLAHLATAEPLGTAQALAAAELSATIFLEWGGAEATQQALANRLATLLSDPALPDASPPQRAAAGRVLARIGDPRDGVGSRGAVPDLAWCAVPGGSCLLGANADEEGASDDERPQHELTLPTFYIARYPITNAQFALFVEGGGYDDPQWWTMTGWEWRNGAEPDLRSIADENLRKAYADWFAQRPAARRREPFFWHDERLNLPNQPVVGVNWYEAMAYCAWLQQQLSVPRPSFAVDGESVYTLLASGNWQVRLPTEAEWEKAAGWDRVTKRKRVYAWGNTWDETKANVAENIGQPSAVGIFPAGVSACGAMDMTGNVWEWTVSQYVEDYPYQNDARHRSEGTTMRTLRGGAWLGVARFARVSCRLRVHPANFDAIAGFRVVVAPGL